MKEPKWKHEEDKKFTRMLRIKYPFSMEQALSTTRAMFKRDPKQVLCEKFNVTREDISNFPLYREFSDFLNEFEFSWPTNDKNVRAFKHFANNRIRYEIPGHWVKPEDHIGIRTDNALRKKISSEDMQ